MPNNKASKSKNAEKTRITNYKTSQFQPYAALKSKMQKWIIMHIMQIFILVRNPNSFRTIYYFTNKNAYKTSEFGNKTNVKNELFALFTLKIYKTRPKTMYKTPVRANLELFGNYCPFISFFCRNYDLASS